MENNIWFNEQVNLNQLPKVEDLNFFPLQKALLKQRYLVLTIFALILLLGSCSIFFMASIKIQTWAFVILLIVLTLFIGFFTVVITKNFAHQAYALRERDIVYRKGWLVKKLKTISFNRVQHTEVNQSFLDRWFGIARLSVFTAGGSFSDLTIPGLLPDTAYALNDFIIKKIAPIRDEEE